LSKESHIFIAGARGMVGSAIERRLKEKGYRNLLVPNREELDLFNLVEVNDFFSKQKIDCVIDAAAKVGGIMANDKYRADFIHQNLLIQVNLFEAAHRNDVDNFLFLGSSCIYPKNSPQPIKEDFLLSSPLEPTNEPYAIAKIAGLKTAESFKRQYGRNYFSLMPTNLYGVNDNFHPQNSHVIPALIQRMNKAIQEGEGEFSVWGTGEPRREFLYVDDLADACIHLLEEGRDIPYWLNVGTGEDISIKNLSLLIAKLMNFKGEVVFDTSKPDGTMLKCLDVSKIKSLGWTPKVSLEEGLEKTIKWYLSSESVRSY